MYNSEWRVTSGDIAKFSRVTSCVSRQYNQSRYHGNVKYFESIYLVAIDTTVKHQSTHYLCCYVNFPHWLIETIHDMYM